MFNDSLVRGADLATSIFEFIPSLDFIRYLGRKEFLRFSGISDSFITKIVRKRQAEAISSVDTARDFLDLLILELQQNPEVSERDVILTLRVLFAAAVMTVSDSLDWILLYLCYNPEVQEKCHKEIKEKLQGRIPKMEDQPSLPYLDSVIKETSRLRPAAPLSVPRVAEQDCIIGGYRVSKGSVIIMNLYGLGNTPTVFEDYSTFNPDRWDKQPELSSKLMQFGTGPTICLGMPIAKYEVFLTAARLLQKYKFQVAPSSPVPDFVGEFKLTYNPKEWHTIITPR